MLKLNVKYLIVILVIRLIKKNVKSVRMGTLVKLAISVGNSVKNVTKKINVSSVLRIEKETFVNVL